MEQITENTITVNPKLSMFSLKEKSDKLFDLPCTISRIGKSNGLKKDGSQASEKAADLLVTITFEGGMYKTFGAYSTSLFPFGIPQILSEGLKGTATFKEQDNGYEPTLHSFVAEKRMFVYADVE